MIVVVVVVVAAYAHQNLEFEHRAQRHRFNHMRKKCIAFKCARFLLI